ncbi:DNA adenine methylase [Kordiimonas sp.]|uniref:DNA adenine methylase n=1 Tax=Kordiimonas sp. TaxID=1970157 RepID=UPI003A91E51C
MPYPGGKNGAGVYQTIINQIPPHETYIEPFVGGGAVFNNMRRAASSIVIDSDASAIRPFQKIPGITAIHGDGLRYLEQRKYTGREFIYADPPYLMKTRRSKRAIYSQEWDTADHVRFLKLVKELPCSIAISGYQSRLYDETLTGWHSITFTAQTRRGPATETLWMNYPAPTALHDCRYLGGNYRERERIKRKAARWASNFGAMPPLERQAVLSAMVERAGSCAAISNDTGIDHRQIERCDPTAISVGSILNDQLTPLEMVIADRFLKIPHKITK